MRFVCRHRWLVAIAMLLLLIPAGQAAFGNNTCSGTDGCSALRALRLKVMLFALVCCLLPAVTLTAAWADFDNRPIVVIRIDDGLSSWLTPFAALGGMTSMDYCASKRIPITWAIITNFADSGGVSWAQFKAYLDANGGEAASHSVTHAPMSTTQGYIDEVTNSKAIIEAHLPGYHCNTFIQPGVWTGEGYMDCYPKLDGPIGQAIQANYAQSRGYLGGGWTIGDRYYPYGGTSDIGIDSQNNPSVARVNGLLDTVAGTPGLVITIMGHGVQEAGQSQSYKIPADILRATMDKLADLRDQGKIRLMGMYDAMNTHFAPDLNRVPDAGFELTDPFAINSPWEFKNATQWVPSGGVDNSHYAYISDGNSYVCSTFLTVQPGRYEMSWYQRVIGGKQNSGLVFVLDNMYPMDQQHTVHLSGANWKFFYNTNPDLWEKKTALALVPERYNISQLRFQPAPGGGYGLDNISLVPSPIDPAVSPTQSVATVSPTQCTISWKTPSDPSITSVMIRHDSGTHPITTNAGILDGSVSAQPGSLQWITVPYNWNGRSYVFFSVFGLKAGGNFTAPDLVVVKVDSTPPPVPTVNCWQTGSSAIQAQWTSSDPDSAVVQYQYAVGNRQGGDSIRGWTYTTDITAAIDGLQLDTKTWVSVKAQNAFGLWSSAGSALAPGTVTTDSLFAQKDGTPVTLVGIVSAIFHDCCYVQDQTCLRGIKITGNLSGLHEGDQVTISGTLRTINGERCIDR